MTYTPTVDIGVWHATRELVVNSVSSCAERTSCASKDLLQATTRLAAWVYTIAELELTPAVVFAPSAIERFIAEGHPNYAPASRGNRRSMLLRMSVTLPGDDATAATVERTVDKFRERLDLRVSAKGVCSPDHFNFASIDVAGLWMRTRRATTFTAAWPEFTHHRYDISASPRAAKTRLFSAPTSGTMPRQLQRRGLPSMQGRTAHCCACRSQRLRQLARDGRISFVGERLSGARSSQCLLAPCHIIPFI